MSDAYQAWRRTKELLAGDHSEETELSAETIGFLDMAEEALRPAALLAFLGSFRGLDTYEEPLECTPDQAEAFLAELDDLRQPTYRPDETRAEMQRQVSEALTAMRKLPWTGDHLYGDALDDASLVLWAVLAGKKMPVLERFRCPSLYQAKKAPLPIRCELQLPHEGKHSVANVGEWTDEQSVNPPKNYDEPPSSNPDPINRPPIEVTDEQLDDLATEVFGDGLGDGESPWS